MTTLTTDNSPDVPSRGSSGISIETGRWVLLATILASSMAFIDSTALQIALDAIQEDLGATGAQLLWTVSAYLVFLSAFLLVGGSLGDHFGRKRIFMLGIIIFTLASVVCGAAPTIEILIAARAVQGIGGSLMVPGSLSIISALFGASRRGQAIGTWSAFSSITTILGPVIGGALVERGIWRAIFFINIPLAIIALTVLYLKVPESHDEKSSKKLDYPGALLATLGLGGIAYGFIAMADRGIDDPGVIAALAVGVISVILFIWQESRSDHPMMPLSVFKSRTFSGTNIMTLFLYGALAGALLFFPLNLIQVQDYAENIAGFALLPFVILLTLMSRWAGGLVDRYGPRIPLTVGPTIVGFGFLVFTLPGVTDGPADYWTTFFPPAMLIGFGMGITVAPLTTAVMGSVSPQQSGVASGINNFLARAANVFAVAIIGSIALIAFSNALESRTDDIPLSSESRAALEIEAENLGKAEVPENVAEENRDDVQAAIYLAFVDTFRITNYIAAGLAFLSAFLAFMFVENRLVQVE